MDRGHTGMVEILYFATVIVVAMIGVILLDNWGLPGLAVGVGLVTGTLYIFARHPPSSIKP